ncbi:MAG: hypothetical protein ACKVWR_17610 [Acidimicrobiales bacterium]
MAPDRGEETSDAPAADTRQQGSNRRQQKAGFSIFLDQIADDLGRAHWETRLYHAESGVETTFEGVSPDHWIGWMLEQLGPTAADRSGAVRDEPHGAVEVASVEILDLTAVQDEAERPASVHTITARVVVQVTGVSRIEQAIGSEVLRTIVEARRRPSPEEPESRS